MLSESPIQQLTRFTHGNLYKSEQPLSTENLENQAAYISASLSVDLQQYCMVSLPWSVNNM
jgi:hypothetical protein